MAERTSYLVILGHEDGLRWVIRHNQMAFGEHRAKEASQVAVGDRLFLYTSRGCFGNPTRDRGRVIGEATVRTPLRRLRKSVRIAEREFVVALGFELELLVPFRGGPELADLLDELEVFPDPHLWSQKLRRSPLRLPSRDAVRIHEELAQVAQDPAETRPRYVAH